MLGPFGTSAVWPLASATASRRLSAHFSRGYTLAPNAVAQGVVSIRAASRHGSASPRCATLPPALPFGRPERCHHVGDRRRGDRVLCRGPPWPLITASATATGAYLSGSTRAAWDALSRVRAGFGIGGVLSPLASKSAQSMGDAYCYLDRGRGPWRHH